MEKQEEHWDKVHSTNAPLHQPTGKTSEELPL